MRPVPTNPIDGVDIAALPAAAACFASFAAKLEWQNAQIVG
jgi:hypothetical protein